MLSSLISDSKRERVISCLLLLLISGITNAGNDKWTSNGPARGELFGFTFHPKAKNIVFAADARGLIRSQDSGLKWQRLDLPNISIYQVRIHPEEADTILAASEVIFKSTDNGDHWQLVADPPFSSRLFDLEFHSQNSETLLGVTANGIFKSIDGGRTWKRKKSLNFALNHLAVDPSNSQIVFVLNSPPGPASGKLFKSTNAGERWNTFGTGLPSNLEGDLVIDPQNSQVMYAGGFAGLFKSTNGGANWFSTNCCPAESISIDPKNSRIIYVTAPTFPKRGAFKSTDAGLTWKKMSYPGGFSPRVIEVHPLVSTLVLSGGENSGIARSLTAGGSWRVVSPGLDGDVISQVERANKKLLSVGSGDTYETLSAGKSWRKTGSGLFFDLAVHFKNPTNLAGAVDSNGVAISIDSGKTWNTKLTPINVHTVAYHPANPNIIYAGGLFDQGIVKTTDKGNTWKSLNSGLTDRSIKEVRTDPTNSSIVYAVTENSIFKSTNEGNSWKAITKGLLQGCRVVQDLDVAPDGTVYVGNCGIVHKSTNRGDQWSAKTMPATEFISIDPKNANHVYSGGGNGGIFFSKDRGETSSSISVKGLEGAYVNDFLVLPSGIFVAATNEGAFTFKITAAPSAPVIDGLSSSTGEVGEGVTIHGRNFGSSQDRVTFGGVDAAISSWTDTRIEVIVPENAQTGPVVVRSSSRKSNSIQFFVIETNTNTNPSTGPSAGGTRVTIVAPLTIEDLEGRFVLFGSVVATDIGLIAPNIIVCTSPPGSPGTVELSLATNSASVKLGEFTYQ